MWKCMILSYMVDFSQMKLEEMKQKLFGTSFVHCTMDR